MPAKRMNSVEVTRHVGHALDSPRGKVLVSGIATPFGALFIATRNGRVIASSGPRDGPEDALAWGRWRFEPDEVEAAGRAHRRLHEEVDEYFAGERTSFSAPLALDGRAFDVRIWEAAREIPYGAALTYGELALDVGAPGRARAVGRAMSICPAPLYVPCHRVVGASGKRCGDPESWERREALRRFEVSNVG
jgi:methylated-DNA-[protein]-cysteine S-methyltransferase